MAPLLFDSDNHTRDKRIGAPLPDIVIPAPQYAMQPLLTATPNYDGLSPLTTLAGVLRPSEQTPHTNRTGRAPSTLGHLGARGQMATRPCNLSTTSTMPERESAAHLFEAFGATRSRALKLVYSRSPVVTSMSLLVLALRATRVEDTTAPTVWTVRRDRGGSTDRQDEIWLVFSTHEEAAAALALSLTNFSFPLLEPALEMDLEPSERFEWTMTDLLPLSYNTMSVEQTGTRPQPCPLRSPLNAFCTSPTSSLSSPSTTCSSTAPMTPQSAELYYDFDNAVHLRVNSVADDASIIMPPRTNGPFALSTNPPNPKMNFRAGDWLCSRPTCNAHNFSRNTTCIGCGNSRPYPNQGHVGPHGSHAHVQHGPHGPPITIPPPGTQNISPRFMSPVSPLSPTTRSHSHGLAFSRHDSPSRGPTSQSMHASETLKPPAPSYPLLTPSGRALSAGGRVRNISVDPMTPCIMYWPDNEPLPERGQIRPLGSAVIQYPPIINTGNKGAAEKQPGDWLCYKCHYLNWRRRKVCQTCYPYAEGNGDSISQAVQAERIALLTNVLDQAEPSLQLQRRASVPVDHHAPYPNGCSSSPVPMHANTSTQPGAVYRGVSRSHSQMDVRGQYQHPAPQPQPQPRSHRLPQQQQRHSQPHDAGPIYQTPVYSPHNISPASLSRVGSPTSALLPSCLQDVIQESTHSSPSSSSADLSFEEYDLAFSPADEYGHGRDGRRTNAPQVYDSQAAMQSIWKLDGEESKALRLPKAAAPSYDVLDMASRVASGLVLVNA